MHGILRLGATVAIGGLVLLGCGNSSSDNPDDDVSITACNADPSGGKPRADGAIKNATKKASAYTFRVRFLDPSGNEVSQAANAVGKVEPAGTASWHVEGGNSAKGPVTCQLANVTRTAVP